LLSRILTDATTPPPQSSPTTLSTIG
jgi:hypothetical protein